MQNNRLWSLDCIALITFLGYPLKGTCFLFGESQRSFAPAKGNTRSLGKDESVES